MQLLNSNVYCHLFIPVDKNIQRTKKLTYKAYLSTYNISVILQRART